MDPHSRASVNVTLDGQLLPRIAACVGATTLLTAHRLVDLSRRHLKARDSLVIERALNEATQDATAELQFCRFRPQPSVLISLVLRENEQLGDDGLAAAVATLEHRSPLAMHALSFACTGTGDKGVHRLAQALADPARLLTLVSLDLSGNAVGADGCCALAGALAAQGSLLYEINLSRNPIGDMGAGHLARGLMHSTTLAKLNLGHACIGGQGARALAGGASMQSSLTDLALHGNRLAGPDGALTVHLLLTSVSSLARLRLSEMAIGPAAAEAVAANLDRVSTKSSEMRVAGVATLAAESNQLAGSGDSLAATPKASSPVAGASECLLPDGRHELVPLLVELPVQAEMLQAPPLALTMLWLERVGLCDGCALARALVSLSCRIEKLWLGGNSLRNDTALAFAGSLASSCSPLRYLDLANNRIGAVGAFALLDSACQGGKLEELALSGNMLSAEEVAALVASSQASGTFLRLQLACPGCGMPSQSQQEAPQRVNDAHIESR